jgi:hypothetical protein
MKGNILSRRGTEVEPKSVIMRIFLLFDFDHSDGVVGHVQKALRKLNQGHQSSLAQHTYSSSEGPLHTPFSCVPGLTSHTLSLFKVDFPSMRTMKATRC